MYIGQQQYHNNSTDAGNVDALPGCRHDLVECAGTAVARNNGLKSAEHAHEKQEQWHPQAGANAYRSKIFGTGMASHYGIDHAVSHLGHLGNQDRAAQNGQGFPLGERTPGQWLAGFR